MHKAAKSRFEKVEASLISLERKFEERFDTVSEQFEKAGDTEHNVTPPQSRDINPQASYPVILRKTLMTELERTVRQRDDEAAHATQQIAALTEKLKKSEARFESKSRSCERLQFKSQELRGHSGLVKADFRSSKGTIKKIQRKLSNAKANTRQLEIKHKEANKKCKWDIYRLDAKVNAYDQDTFAFEADLDHAKSVLKKSRVNASENILTHIAKESQYQVVIEDPRKHLAARNADIDSLRRSFSDRDSKISALEQETQDLRRCNHWQVLRQFFSGLQRSKLKGIVRRLKIENY